ncbi:MAG: DUF3822 family protein [Bacteroidales bacterium]|nr:DUF3822 family protein [Bacteroidales bacterium]
MAEIFTAIHSYSDPGLDKQKYYEYDLSIRMNADGFSFCILDTNTNKYLHLESFDLKEPGMRRPVPGEGANTDPSSLIRLLEENLNWLSSPFNNTSIIYDEGKSTLVPEALFDKKEEETVYAFNVAKESSHHQALHHDHIKSVNAFSVYGIPSLFDDLIDKYFSGAPVFHHSTAFIQSLFLKYMNQDTGNILFVNAGASRLDLLRITGKKLNYYNSFTYHTAEDFMYYLIFVVEQLKLNPENIELIITGELDKHSSLSDLLHKYIRNISFADRNTDFRYSFVFDQLPGHYYYNLLNAAMCE